MAFVTHWSVNGIRLPHKVFSFKIQNYFINFNPYFEYCRVCTLFTHVAVHWVQVKLNKCKHIKTKFDKKVNFMGKKRTECPARSRMFNNNNNLFLIRNEFQHKFKNFEIKLRGNTNSSLNLLLLFFFFLKKRKRGLISKLEPVVVAFFRIFLLIKEITIIKKYCCSLLVLPSGQLHNFTSQFNWCVV